MNACVYLRSLKSGLLLAIAAVSFVGCASTSSVERDPALERAEEIQSRHEGRVQRQLQSGGISE